eukprot:COSAG02_NODE_2277_length_9240_cov_4.345914_10_plen_64_part_00
MTRRKLRAESLGRCAIKCAMSASRVAPVTSQCGNSCATECISICDAELNYHATQCEYTLMGVR